MNQLCQHRNECGACENWSDGLDSQREQKKNSLIEILKVLKQDFSNIEVLSSPMDSIRHRIELSFKDSWGFYSSKDSRKIVPIEYCQITSPQLNAFLTDFKNLNLSFSHAGARLRISPQNKKGIWLDLPNIEIKNLLNSTILNELMSICDEVELGQKKKIVAFKLDSADKKYALIENPLNSWFKTWSKGREIPLFFPISGFSQPSWYTNELILKTLSQFLMELQDEEAEQLRSLEFGSGSGNLSFCIAGHSSQLTCLEIDSFGLKGLEKSLQSIRTREEGFSDCNPEKFRFWQGDFQRLRKDLSLRPSDEPYNFIAVNPPRSGLKEFTSTIIDLSPKHFFYMSCYPESFYRDMSRIIENGYRLRRIALVDQFPHTSHYEIMSLWTMS